MRLVLGGGGAGGISLVARTTYSNGEASPQNVPLPESQSGDVLVLAFLHNTNATVSTTSGWTSHGNQLDGPARFPNRSYVWSRTADGTEGATVTISNNNRIAATCYSLRGASGNVEAASANGGDLSAEPPNLTPSWGAKENYWIVPVFWGHGSMSVSGFPADLLNGIEFGLNLGNNGSADGAVADQVLEAESFQPDPFTFSQGGADGDDVGWAAWNIAVEAA